MASGHADIIPIGRGVKRPKQRVCSNCEYAALGISGVFCRMYDEEMWNELIARECEEYKEQ